MRRSLATVVLASLAFAAQGNEGVELSLSSRSLASAGTIAPKSVAVSFKSVAEPLKGAADPMPEILLREEQDHRTVRGTCENSTAALCYDMAERRVQYRQARNYMPAMEGLRAESVSLRHNSLVFKYSFR
jgi:hypothetical protein